MQRGYAEFVPVLVDSRDLPIGGTLGRTDGGRVEDCASPPATIVDVYPLTLELAAQARVELGAYVEALELYSRSLDVVHRKEPQSSA